MFRNIPAITKNLLIVNFLAFIATWILNLRGVDLASIGGLHFFFASDFHLFQFFTYMFLHADLSHIFFNMFALWMFGVVVENVWGGRKFLFYYIFCGVGAGLMQELVQFIDFYYRISSQNPNISFSQLFIVGQQLSEQLNGWTTIGASGAVYAILLAFGMLFPNERIFIFPLPVAHMAHLGGMLFGFLLIRYWNSHPDAHFNRSGGEEFFNRMKRNFEQRKGSGGTSQNSHMHAERGATREDDMEYNARKKARQDEIDAILDKIRKSGYDSLTKEEKKRLFDASNGR